MSAIYRLPRENGTFSPWSYYSESRGSILEFESEEAAKESLAAEVPANISTILGGQDAETNDGESDDSSDDAPEAAGPIRPQSEQRSSVVAAPKRGRPRKVIEVEPEEDDTPSPLSAAFIRKLKDRLASGTATISVELERFLIKRYGFTTEELDDDDEDVDLIKMGWAAMWESLLKGKAPPWWLLVSFGHVCVTARLIAMAKRSEPKQLESAPETPPKKASLAVSEPTADAGIPCTTCYHGANYHFKKSLQCKVTNCPCQGVTQ
jgi:hypothetical protein